MRLNLGIRRRLAPLLDNDRRRIELMNGMLMSLPGTPIIYYGDEIGMGDNINLGDRNGVRTPMQWSGGWNGGFSTADPESLYAPLDSESGLWLSCHQCAVAAPHAALAAFVDAANDRGAAIDQEYSATDRSNFFIPRITGFWPTFAASRMRQSWWSTIFRAPRRRWNSTCGASKEAS